MKTREMETGNTYVRDDGAEQEKPQHLEVVYKVRTEARQAEYYSEEDASQPKQ